MRAGTNRHAPLLSHFVAQLDAGALESDPLPRVASRHLRRLMSAASGGRDTVLPEAST
jgi:hypothetical protein